MIGAFSRPFFNLVPENLPQSIKLSNLMLMPPQFGYQTCVGHLPCGVIPIRNLFIIAPNLGPCQQI